jgi:hypothetical protein
MQEYYFEYRLSSLSIQLNPSIKYSNFVKKLSKSFSDFQIETFFRLFCNLNDYDTNSISFEDYLITKIN